MSVFKSAMGYFSSGGANGSAENEFVGQLVDIGNMRLRVKRVIAEGGFAFVYVAQDTATGTEYALKRLMAADEQANKNIIQEISILKKLSGHPNIIKYIAASFIDKSKTNHGMAEYLLLTDLCQGGSLMEVLQNRGNPFPLHTVLRIFYQMCRAVQHMHAQTPPIAHRDLKLENFLISSDGTIKLCDFGSATTEVFTPDPSWSANQRNMLEENLAVYTTPMYRAPELLDTWDHRRIDSSVDVWALGCVLHLLCFLSHPFEDSAKLAILNGNYSIPNETTFSSLHDVIRSCLTVNPENRPSLPALLDRLSSIADGHDVRLKEPLKFERTKVEQSVATTSPGAPAEVLQPPPLAASMPSASLLSSLKGGAGSLFKSLKDTSNKVMHTVQQSIARSELDASFLTSRVLVMPHAAEGIEGAYKANHADDVRIFLESRELCSSRSVAWSVGNANLPKSIPCRDCSSLSRSLSLPLLFSLAHDMYLHLAKHNRNILIICCPDGKSYSCLLWCGLALYSRFCSSPEDALQLFAVKRSPLNMAPSQLRYLQYLSQIIRSEPEFPHFRPMTLLTLTVQPVPLFTKARDGCRPYVEIYNDGKLIISTLKDYESLHLYMASEGKMSIPLNCSVVGDVSVKLYHTRSQLGRLLSVPVLVLAFHAGMHHDPDLQPLLFHKSDLDVACDSSLCGSSLSSSISFVWQSVSRSNIALTPWTQDETFALRNNDVLFSTQLEKEEAIDNFVCTESDCYKAPIKKPPRPQPPRSYGDTAEQTIIPSKEDTADFLNLSTSNANKADGPSSSQPIGSQKLKSEDSFDLFAMMDKPASQEDHFGDFVNIKPVHEPEPFAPSDWSNEARSKPMDGFDPFGLNENITIKEETLLTPQRSERDTSNSQQIGSQPVPNSEDKIPNKDPFADLGLLGDNLTNVNSNLGVKGQQTNSQTPQPSPTHRPDYSRSHFEPAKSPMEENKAKGSDVFDELLGQGYGFTSRKEPTNKSMNQMRNVLNEREMDPDAYKIHQWCEGKRANIRALLCSLSSVVWEDCRWSGCSMAQLVTKADVKKNYRKACLAVHPDKQMGTPNENLAKMIFMELNNAWTDFENDSAQQNLFAS